MRTFTSGASKATTPISFRCAIASRTDPSGSSTRSTTSHTVSPSWVAARSCCWVGLNWVAKKTGPRTGRSRLARSGSRPAASSNLGPSSMASAIRLSTSFWISRCVPTGPRRMRKPPAAVRASRANALMPRADSAFDATTSPSSKVTSPSPSNTRPVTTARWSRGTSSSTGSV